MGTPRAGGVLVMGTPIREVVGRPSRGGCGGHANERGGDGGSVCGFTPAHALHVCNFTPSCGSRTHAVPARALCRALTGRSGNERMPKAHAPGAVRLTARPTCHIREVHSILGRCMPYQGGAFHIREVHAILG
eukprot:2729307-Prymnesium_polylepis.1